MTEEGKNTQLGDNSRYNYGCFYLQWCALTLCASMANNIKGKC